MLARLYARWGRWVAFHPRRLVALWLILLAVSLLGSTRIGTVLATGTSQVPGSLSARTEALIQREFSNPFTELLVVTLQGDPKLNGDRRAAWKQLATDLAFSGAAQRVLVPGDASPVALSSATGDLEVALVGLQARDAVEALALVPRVREQVHTWAQRHFGERARVAVTGMPAVTYDLNQSSSSDTSRAEARLMPVTLVVLVLAFGGLVASGLPLLVGMAGTVMSLGAAYALSHWLSMSIYVQNVASMLGLAVGIDYSLLMVHRYRKARSQGFEGSEAIAETLRTAGVAVTYSGLTVLVGLGALGATPLLDTRSIGLGGVLVVVLAVLQALSLLPALLAWLGDRIDAPRALSRRVLAAARETQWVGWVQAVVRHPWRSVAVAVVVLGALAWPATRLVNGYPDTRLFPSYMESVQGVDTLNRLGHSGLLIPLQVVVEDTRGPILSARNLGALLKLSADLRREAIVGSVVSPVDLAAGLSPLQYALLYRDPEAAFKRYPLIGQLFVSHDRRMVLFQVAAHRSADLAGLRELADRLAGYPLPDGLKMHLGGTPVYYNDFDRAVTGSYPAVFAVVVGVTLLVMAIAFRSILVPVKAVLLNLLSVACGYGAVVMVFQFGWLRPLVGMSLGGETMAIPVLIPLLLFGIVFGLSMDYEVFLMSAIKEAHDQHGDNTRAIVEGTCGTARLITSAAAIMVAVFGAFAWADFVIVKMLGLGLAVAVLVDATVIRLLLLPAVMQLAGRANWYPGTRVAAVVSREPRSA